jgi:hypothetical protein
MKLLNRFQVEVEAVGGDSLTYKINDLIDGECFSLTIPFNAEPLIVIENTLIEKISYKRDRKIHKLLND